jgi:TolB-like protein/tetratricopeptide (TPR) repeat protein
MELRRRRVFRMTAIYIVAAWVAVQIASEVFPAFNIPEGAIRYVWVGVLIGFPLAVLFSWKYDFTTSGIRRTPAAHEDVAAVHSLTRVDYGVLAMLALVSLVIVFGVGQRLIEVQTETGRAPTTRAIDPNSIAVLPLESLSPNSDDAYFAAGVHDALITNLSRITALMVTSGTSARRVNSELSVPQIGRQLGVANVLEGSVLMDGDRVRVIVQLIDAASDLHLWADTFEREVADIISLQNEIARTIANVVEVRLTPREEATLADTKPVRPDTYRAYLKGMYQLFQDTPEADRRGIEILEEVVRQDPTSALAYAGLAYGYANLVHSPSPPPFENMHAKAKAAADIALQLDPELAEAHMAVGMYRLMYEWDFEGAEKALKRAIKLNPSLALAHYDLAWLYELLGPEWEEESLARGDRTRELNPLSPYMVGALAWQYADACRYEEALDLAREAIRLDPEHPVGWAALGLTYAELGQFDEAIDAHRRLADTVYAPWVGMTYAAAGLEDKAREVAAAWEKIPGAALAPAWIYMNLGDRESALHWIAETETARVSWYPWLLGMFHGSGLIADDPRLQARAAALGLPDPRTMGCGT